MGQWLIDSVPDHDPEIVREMDRLNQINHDRTSAAEAYSRENAVHWDRVRSIYVDEATIEKKTSGTGARTGAGAPGSRYRRRPHPGTVRRTCGTGFGHRPEPRDAFGGARKAGEIAAGPPAVGSSWGHLSVAVERRFVRPGDAASGVAL